MVNMAMLRDKVLGDDSCSRKSRKVASAGTSSGKVFEKSGTEGEKTHIPVRRSDHVTMSDPSVEWSSSGWNRLEELLRV